VETIVAHETQERVTVSPLAGKPAPKAMLVDLAGLEQAYYQCNPDASDPNQRVSFGTSGHRGSPFRASFTDAHLSEARDLVDAVIGGRS
jgi:hypothetical protein